MVAEKLWATSAAFFFDLFKEIGHGVGIEPGVVHDVRTQQVRFRLGLT